MSADTLTNMTTLRAFAVAIALGLVATACGGSSAPVAPAEVSMGTFDTVAGSQIDFGSIEGQDTVLWFWAPW